jgi:cytochrome c-type protein NapB
MKKSILTLLAATALSGGAWAGQLESLRGNDITAASQEPGRYSVMEVRGGIERSFREQPPMVPHPVEKYEINLKVNGCMKCHSPETYEREKSPKIGDSHFLDRDGNQLERISSRRYFCTQCHTPQLSGDPLVNNLFEGRK